MMLMKQTFTLAILISIIVISEENHDNIISFLDDETQQNTNITCFCIGDEKCDTHSRTCRITNPDHACYESWTKYPYDVTIHLSAG